MDISANVRRLQEHVARACERAGRSPKEVTIVGVIKTVPVEAIREAFLAGIRQFGENRVQEAAEKKPHFVDIAPMMIWRMVGHLQGNKVKRAVEVFDSIDSVDSTKLAKLLNANARTKMPVLIEVNILGETTKTGFPPSEVPGIIEELASMPNLNVHGLMGIAPLTEDKKQIRFVFQQLQQLRQRLGLAELSMGMSSDYEIAIEEGATMIRIGRAIFGERVK
ncbi:MAG: YggS family pyridoxal phosphate-dependent enzyme [Chloroflexi bacterium]|nr:YggS family pyridoxal phosphate-dependent enzyme [Chloroflexota bacterium]